MDQRIADLETALAMAAEAISVYAEMTLALTMVMRALLERQEPGALDEVRSAALAAADAFPEGVVQNVCTMLAPSAAGPPDAAAA